MSEHLELQGQTIKYVIKKNRRARQVRILVHSNGRITISAPRFVTQKFIRKFLLEKKKWVIATLAKCQPEDKQRVIIAKLDFQKNKKLAAQTVRHKLTQFCGVYNLHPKKIFIRNQSTRWGSCSSKGNLSFNFRLIYLPENLLDYLIVHEICHLGEMNHSHHFWSLVARAIPDYKKRKAALREAGRQLL
ncbi:MAG: M48 family metallopeptidase [Candidatus Magasanikbacteria bacterium]|nr:M48 family metallopeptidase [Candidatus Magasanikbacteria bacterium]